MDSRNLYTNQLKNRNFLSSIGFKFTLSRAKQVSFFSNSVNIPGVTLGVAEQPTFLKNIDLPGDKMYFEDFVLRFIVDENLENYMQIQNWMRGLGFPESVKEVQKLQQTNKQQEPQSKSMDIYSDGTLTVLGSSNTPIFKVTFSDLWPYSLTTLNFDATETDVNFFTAEVGFKYTIYDITDLSGTNL